MNKGLIPILLLFSLAGCPSSLQAGEGTAEVPAGSLTPWLTGPLIALSGEVVQGGHYDIQPFFHFNTVTGIYDRHWHNASSPNFFNFTLNVQIIVGMTKWMDFQISPQGLYNSTQGQSSTLFGDFPFTLDFQLLATDKFKWFPGIKLELTETFPTGKYQKLKARKLDTDLSGLGSFATSANLVFYKVYHLARVHYLSMTASFGYTYYAPVHVRGFNAYGGGSGCAGKVYPGNSYSGIVSFEFTLNKNWVLAIDHVYTHSDKERFRGTPGIGSSLSVPGAVSPHSSENLSFAPAIEYNFNEHWGIIAGTWVSAIGRNSFVFRNAIFSFEYQY
jgi:hypothetical protein